MLGRQLLVDRLNAINTGHTAMQISELTHFEGTSGCSRWVSTHGTGISNTSNIHPGTVGKTQLCNNMSTMLKLIPTVHIDSKHTICNRS